MVRGWAEEGQKGAARMVTGTIGDPSEVDNPYTWRLAGQERTMGKYLKLSWARKGRYLEIILGRKGRITWAGNTKEKQGLGLLLHTKPN